MEFKKIRDVKTPKVDTSNGTEVVTFFVPNDQGVRRLNIGELAIIPLGVEVAGDVKLVPKRGYSPVVNLGPEPRQLQVSISNESLPLLTIRAGDVLGVYEIVKKVSTTGYEVGEVKYSGNEEE